MCGIGGVMLEEPVEQPWLDEMVRTLSHRGPDDSGTWISEDKEIGLVHTRLTIIDLSRAARQPMSNEAGTVWLTYNGEIYNFRDLRHVLETMGHRFRTASDTEVIIHAYEQWGIACVSKLRGMFAFGLWDTESKELFLVRDRVGIKPLNYYWDGRRFAFASELKAIVRLPGLDRKIDRSAVFDYLTYLYVPTPKTAYRRMRKVPPGHFLTFANDSVSLTRYWDVPLAEDDSITERGALELLDEKLEDAVTMSMVSDVPVGAFLSGGLDSGTVLAQMAKTCGEIRSFTMDFDVSTHSESAYARSVAEHVGSNHSERMVGREAPGEMLERIVACYDEPFGDGSAMPTLFLSEFARESVKVVLSGDGGDEVFAGYNWYRNWLRLQTLRRLIPLWVRSGFSAWAKQMRWGYSRGLRLRHMLAGSAMDPLQQYAHEVELLNPEEKRAVLGGEWRSEFRDYDDYWYYRQFWRPELNPITRVQYLDLKTYLPDDILTKVDRASMAVGLEVRPALLDHVLIESVFRIPPRYLWRKGQGKYILRKLMSKRLPAGTLKRPKKGFSAPLSVWLDSDSGLIRRTLGASGTYVRPGNLSALEYRARGAKYWAILVLEEWAKRTANTSESTFTPIAEGVG